MKRITFILLAAVITLMATAQTNFRAISYKEALAAAKAENKQVFIDFYTDWCGPCKRMARETFPQKSVGDYMNGKFVSIQVNAEKGEGVALAKQWKVDAYPTFVVITSEEEETGRCLGFRSSGAFITELEKMRNPELRTDRMIARYKAGERDPQLIQAYAAYLKDSHIDTDNTREAYFKTRDMVNKMVQDYYAGLTDAQKRSKENFFVYRSYTASVNEAPAKYLVANRQRFAPELRAEVDSIIGEIYKMEVYFYLSGENAYDAAKLKTIGRTVKQLKLDKNGRFKAAFLFLQPRAQKPEAMAEAIDKHFYELDDEYQAGLMDGLMKHFKSADPVTKKMLARSLRNKLPHMSLESIYTAVMIIPQLEGQTGH